MAQYSFAWAGSVTGDAGPYTDTLFTQFLEDLYNQRNRANAGVLQSYNDGVNASLEVDITSPASASVLLRVGSALVQGRYYVNDADLTLPIAANVDGSGWDRIDTVVLEVDFTNQEIRAVVVEGTAAAAPVAPTLTQNASIYQIPLADVDVPNLFVTITTGIDNTVRDYAQLLDILEGGTGKGYNDYVSREMLIGVSGAAAWEKLTGFTLERTTNGAALAIGAWQTIEITEGVDPDSLVSVASNQMTFAKAGYYHIKLFVSILNGAAGSSLKLFRLRNITTGATLIVGQGVRIATSSRAYAFPALNGIFTVAASDVVEIQVWATIGTSQIETESGTLGTEASRSLYATVKRYTAN